MLPTDIVVDTEFPSGDREPQPRVVAADEIPDDASGWTSAPTPPGRSPTALAEAQTVFWNGPMGVFETPGLRRGHPGRREALTEVDGLSVVGGGDSAAAVRRSASTRTRSATSRPAAAPASSTSRARSCPALAVLEG